MLGFDKIGEFERAFNTSHPDGLAHLASYELIRHDLEFAEGMLFGVTLMLPFWTLFVCLLGLILR
jgi:hypothetical protein